MFNPQSAGELATLTSKLRTKQTKGVNTANLLRVANAIEQHSIKWLGFNMGTVLCSTDNTFIPDLSKHNCDTVGCIAGWTLALFDGIDIHFPIEGNWPKRPAEILGLNHDQAYQLFCKYPHGGITPAQAAQALRHVAFTGDTKGCWSHAQ